MYSVDIDYFHRYEDYFTVMKVTCSNMHLLAAYDMGVTSGFSTTYSKLWSTSSLCYVFAHGTVYFYDRSQEILKRDIKLPLLVHYYDWKCKGYFGMRKYTPKIWQRYIEICRFKIWITLKIFKISAWNIHYSLTFLKSFPMIPNTWPLDLTEGDIS